MEKYDLIIVGSGPGGLSAGIYAARYNLNFLVISEINGGLMAEAHKICNFPTEEEITGFELTQKMVKHLESLGGKIKQEKVEEIKNEGDFLIKTNKEEYSAKKVILAIGTKKRKLNVKGDRDYYGRGVSYCATCDAAFYKDKTVAIIGGGDSAVTSALLLSEFAKKVYIIYRRDKFYKAEPAWVGQAEKEDKIEFLFNSELEEIYGDDKEVKGVKLKNGSSIELDGVFIEVGSIPNEIIPKQLGLDTEEGYIIVNNKQETNVKGVFAVGDITNNPLKQVITACGEGAVAADSAYSEITKENN